MLRLITAGIALIPAALLLAAPAQAQSADEKVNQLIIYGDDPCPQSNENEITVCARKAETERFRIPENLRESNSPQNRAWTDRVLAYETVGSAGTLSCSAVGPGGMTGCTGKMIDTAYAEKRADPNIRFSELIADRARPPHVHDRSGRRRDAGPRGSAGTRTRGQAACAARPRRRPHRPRVSACGELILRPARYPARPRASCQ